MPRVAPPDETDILCEECGYRLNNLPTTGRCPECGKPIEESLGQHRRFSEFELSPSIVTFLRTSWAILWRPAEFYRTISTRSNRPAAKIFSIIHRLLSSLLFIAAALGHLLWVETQLGASAAPDLTNAAVLLILAVPIMFLLLTGLTRLAAWLSAIEAKYWGMRLPQHVVRRGLDFHSVDYIPVGLFAVAIVWGYRLLLVRRIINGGSDTLYLYTLCGTVILSAMFLFSMYWIAMKNMMNANR